MQPLIKRIPVCWECGSQIDVVTEDVHDDGVHEFCEGCCPVCDD